MRRRLEGHVNSISSLAVAKDGKRLVSASWDRTLRVWDLATGQAIAYLVGQNIKSIAFTPDGHAALGTDGDDLRLWDLQAGQTIQIFGRQHGVVTSLALSPDGRTALSGSSPLT